MSGKRTEGAGHTEERRGASKEREDELKRLLEENLRILVALPILGEENRYKLRKSLDLLTGESVRSDVRAAELRNRFQGCGDES